MQDNDSAARARASLFARLQARSREIEEGVVARVDAIGTPTETDDPDYLHGFRAAIKAAIEFGLAVIESGESHTPPVPVALLTQARMAARHSVSLDTVIRRYVAGRDELHDFLLEEIEGIEMRGIRTARPLGALGAAFDRLLADVGREYALELRRWPNSPHTRRADRVKGLLAGEHLDASELAYDFDLHHLGLVAEGDAAPNAIRALANALNGRLLLVHPATDTVWAWIGLREPAGRGGLNRILATTWPASLPLALSEPILGISGWRLSHKQAREVFPFAVSPQPGIRRYADHALLTSMAKDGVLTASLREIYLTPLEGGRDGGAADRETLCAYFAAGRNGRAAAAALGMSRQTVSNRLKSIEEKIGRPLLACATDLELTLRLANHDLI
jgi:hypothetical protein